MKTLLLLIVFVFCLHIDASGESIEQPLGRKDVAMSPNKMGACYMDFDGKDWNFLILKTNLNKVLLWKCVRSVGVSWSPNSRYLAVEDYLVRLSSVVLIFRVDLKAGASSLIYQTPYSDSIFEKYHIVKWSKDGDSISLQREMPTGSTSQETIDLDDRRPITQSVYAK